MKRTLKTVATVALAGFVVASCSSLNKMKRLEKNIAYKVTPEMLEAKGGQVDLKIDATIPAKYFNKKVTLVATPVLKFQNGGEKAYDPKTFQGEKVQGNNEVVPYATEKTVNYSGTVPFEEGMRVSGLYVKFQGSKGKKSADYESRKIADGVISTSEMIGQTLGSANPANGDDAFQRIIKEKHDANIMFLIQQANVRASELKTAKEFNEEVKNIDGAVNKKISNIEISAYASPDGGVSLNTKLAENRQDNTAKVINQNLKKSKVDAAIDTKYTAQDWQGFQELVSKSNIQDKELILRVLSMYSDPEQREQEIKNISSVYKNLADDILPQLRRSRLTLNYEIIGKSDEEIASLAASDPKQLNIEELLYATTLTNDPAKQEVIFTKATQIYPNDFRAYNNLGKLAYQAGNLDKAESYFKKAASIKDAPEVNMNLGLIALTKGDKAAAESYLSKASGAKELNEALGNLYIAQGQYDRAVSAFGDTKTNSAALAQILAKDYNKAKNTLASVAKPDAYTDYLMAVLGARTNNASMVTSSLKNAVAKEPSLAKKAASDLEFAKYFTNAEFMSIAQ